MICINKVRVNRCKISIRKTKCFLVLALAFVRLNRNDAGGARGTAFSVGGDGDSSRVLYRVPVLIILALCNLNLS